MYLRWLLHSRLVLIYVGIGSWDAVLRLLMPIENAIPECIVVPIPEYLVMRGIIHKGYVLPIVVQV